MKKLILCALPLAFMVSSCSTVYYSPTAHTVPMFEEKNEVRVSAHSGSADNINTVDLQAAYSVTNNVAVLGSFFNAKGNDNSDLSGTGNQFDIGGGYYKPFGSRFVFEAYGMFGNGNADIRYATDSMNDRISSGFNKFYIQPSIAYTSQYFDIALSNRLVYLNMNKVEGGNNYEKFREDRNKLNAGKNAMLYEVGITVRGGYKYVKLQLQTTLGTFVSSKQYPANRASTSIGLVFSLGSSTKRAFNPIKAE